MKKETTWKEFGKNDLTHSSAHYLMTIHHLLETQGYARLSDVAKRLNISKGSLSTSLKPLFKKNLIEEDDNKHIFLTEEGQNHAIKIKNTDVIFKHFLTDILNVDEETAEIDACKVEHLLSTNSTAKILKLIKALEGNPDLLTAIQKEIKNHSCTPAGCKECKKNECCIKED